MSDWKFPKAAPNFIPLRVRVRLSGTHSPLRELPYLLVRDDDRWFYSRTMVPVYPWHKPVLWTDTPRTDDERIHFDTELARLWGDVALPSGRAVQA